MWVEVDEAAFPAETVIPARLQMRDLHGVADGLHVARCLPRLRPEDGGHAAAQQVTHCTGRIIYIQFPKLLKQL